MTGDEIRDLVERELTSESFKKCDDIFLQHLRYVSKLHGALEWSMQWFACLGMLLTHLLVYLELNETKF